MHYDDPRPELPQTIARPQLIPLRWARSQKLIGYLDTERGELVYQDRTGRVVDRVSLSVDRSDGRTDVIIYVQEGI